MYNGARVFNSLHTFLKECEEISDFKKRYEAFNSLKWFYLRQPLRSGSPGPRGSVVEWSSDINYKYFPFVILS